MVGLTLNQLLLKLETLRDLESAGDCIITVQGEELSSPINDVSIDAPGTEKRFITLHMEYPF